MAMKKSWQLLLGIALVLAGLGGLAVLRGGQVGQMARPGYGNGIVASAPQSLPSSAGPGGMMGRFARVPRPLTISSNAQRIYFTGFDDAGVRIQPTLPMAAMMGLACADCHGTDRRGGIVMPDGTTKSADISARGLASLTATQVATAITQGLDEKGKQFSAWMPSWAISDADLADLVAYLKTAP